MKISKILLVEDDDIQRRIFQTALQGHGFSVFSCCNGEEAVQKVSLVKPDVIVMDYFMPEMDGITAMKKIKSTYKNIPVVLMSADLVNSNGCPMLRKPFAINDLIEIIYSFGNSIYL